MKPTSPKPPKHLTASGKKLWNSIFEESEFDAAGLLLLNTLCEQFDRMNEARAILKKDGLQVKDRFDQVKPNPALSVEVNAIAAITRCWRLLGFDQVPAGAMGRPPGR